jgi:hypothetical protein
MAKICAVIIDTFDGKLLTRHAINQVLKMPNISYVYTFCEFPIVVDSRVRFIKIPKLKNTAEYNHFIINQLHAYIHQFEESHCLIFQWDGFPLSPKKWNDIFLDYDYIGAPWYSGDVHSCPVDMAVVGNSGFCLASIKLFKTIINLGIVHDMDNHINDDVIICIKNRARLEEAGIKFAPPQIASNFSEEARLSRDSFCFNSLGFHAAYNFPYVFSESEIILFLHELYDRLGSNHYNFHFFLNSCAIKSYRNLIKIIINNKEKHLLIKNALFMGPHSQDICNFCSKEGIDLSSFR